MVETTPNNSREVRIAGQATLMNVLNVRADGDSKESQLSGRIPFERSLSWASKESRRQRSELVSEENLVMEYGIAIDLDEDVYGAAVFTLTYDCFEILSGKDHDGLDTSLNIFRMVFILTLLLFNYVLQLSMLYWIYFYLASEARHRSQSLYREYHQQAFSKGHFDSERWHSWDSWKRESLCSLCYVTLDFLYLVICIWWARMVDDVRKTERTMRKFRDLETTDSADDMIVKAIVGGKEIDMVVQLHPIVRILLWSLLLIPKFCIGFLLIIVGTSWLAATDSWSELILNALALRFVVLIDEVLFHGLLPETIKSNIAKCKLMRTKQKKTGNDVVDAIDAEQKGRDGLIRSVLYTCVILGGVLLYLTFGQTIPILGVYPNYKHDADCPAWYKRITAQVCQFGKECFPLG